MLNSKVKTLIASTMCASVGLSALPINVIANADTQTKYGEEYQERFMDLWGKIHDSNNGYFKQFGDLKVPYHSVETLMIEAPDYGHETTSEAFSYYVWLEAMYGKFTGDWSEFQDAWKSTEKFIIPNDQDQKGLQAGYNPSSAATFANEYPDLSQYPSRLQQSKSVKDPLANELKNTYGSNKIYGTHWLLDVDNWYGFGNNGNMSDTTRPSYINTFQRGSSESVWKAIPQPSFEMFQAGGQYGYLDLFTKEDTTPSKQWKNTNAPDADARTIQATYWADKWAEEQGKSSEVSEYVGKAAMLGDFLRYSMFDKYFQPIGVGANNITNNEGKHYLLSWYYAWGGAAQENQGNWGWRIGSSHNHFGYQSPMAAWILSNNSNFKPKSANGASDWATSLDRQLEFYQWLQSSEGAIAGGATNSYVTSAGSYQQYPAGTSTFYGMAYDYAPVYRDPASNKWFGMQCWSMQRMADYYYQTGDKRAEKILDKWAQWVNANVIFEDGDYKIPGDLEWSGQPDTWTGTYTGNPDLHVTITAYSQDVGMTGSLANTLMHYSAACSKYKGAEDTKSTEVAEKLLDCLWNKHQDEKGISVEETRGDYSKIFTTEVYVPSGWTGSMPNGDAIKSGIKFLDIRSKYKNDPDFARVEQAYKAGVDPVFKYHRFWGESDVALALGTASILNDKGEIHFTGGDVENKVTLGDVNGDNKVNIKDYVKLQKYVMNPSSVTIVEANADMNEDGKINITDVMLLKKALMN